MTDINYWAVLVAAVAAFLAAFGYYVAFGAQLVKLSSAAAERDKPPPWLIPVELVRAFLVALVVAGVASRMDVEDWTGALILGVALWIGFPLVLLSGSVLHEKVPWKLAALHSGDWLVKLLLISVIVGVWR